MPTRNKRVLVPDITTLLVPQGDQVTYPVSFSFGQTMGTTWRCHFVLSPGHRFDDIITLIEQTLALVIDQMSHWDPRSSLSRYNRAMADTWVAIPDEFFIVLTEALGLAEKTGGLYDPTVGHVIQMLGFGPEPPASHRVDLDSLRQNDQRYDWKSVSLDFSAKRVLQPGQIHLDLSSIAKGFAVDLVSERLLDIGLNHFLFEIGGEFRGEGCKPNGTPWWVGLESIHAEDKETADRESPASPEVIIAACGLSIATSGPSHHRHVLPDGKMISHLVNAVTCDAQVRELSSVTVIERRCIQADGWATALFVAGLETGLELAEQHRIAAIFSCKTGKAIESSQISTLFDS
ncbi:FAD:protein FMN transferase [Pirellulaceae bacterium SH449]